MKPSERIDELRMQIAMSNGVDPAGDVTLKQYMYLQVAAVVKYLDEEYQLRKSTKELLQNLKAVSCRCSDNEPGILKYAGKR